MMFSKKRLLSALNNLPDFKAHPDDHVVISMHKMDDHISILSDPKSPVGTIEELHFIKNHRTQDWVLMQITTGGDTFYFGH